MDEPSLIEIPLNSTCGQPESLSKLVPNPEVPDHNPYNKPLKTVGVGLVKLVEAPLKGSKSQLDELTSKQQELIARLHQENCNIAEVQYSQELQAMFVKMKQYHLKLQSIKKDIRGLHDKSQKLKKRALKLKEIKEKDPQEEIIITKPTSVISVNSEGVSTSQTG